MSERRGTDAQLALLLRAAAFAQRKHVGQRRTVDGAPFILHPLEVGAVLGSVGAPEPVVAGGILHDTLEKTDATGAELREQFGGAVARTVEAVSEDGRIADYRDRKAALRRQVAVAGRDALMVFAADKISKVRELRLAASTAAWPASGAPLPLRVDHYQHCLDLVGELLDDSRLVNSLGAELERLIAAAGAERLCAGAA